MACGARCLVVALVARQTDIVGWRRSVRHRSGGLGPKSFAIDSLGAAAKLLTLLLILEGTGVSPTPVMDGV